MFNNVGGKIKAVAKVTAWIGIAICVIYGFVMLVSVEDMALVGLLIMTVGSLASWISALVLYGFGHLIENSEILVSQGSKTTHHNTTNNYTPSTTTNNTAPSATNSAHKWRCSRCGNMISEEVCPFCNKGASEKIDTLNKWKEQGLITEEEYQATKNGTK